MRMHQLARPGWHRRATHDCDHVDVMIHMCNSATKANTYVHSAHAHAHAQHARRGRHAPSREPIPGSSLQTFPQPGPCSRWRLSAAARRGKSAYAIARRQLNAAQHSTCAHVLGVRPCVQGHVSTAMCPRAAAAAAGGIGGSPDTRGRSMSSSGTCHWSGAHTPPPPRPTPRAPPLRRARNAMRRHVRMPRVCLHSSASASASASAGLGQSPLRNLHRRSPALHAHMHSERQQNGSNSNCNTQNGSYARARAQGSKRMSVA